MNRKVFRQCLVWLLVLSMCAGLIPLKSVHAAEQENKSKEKETAQDNEYEKLEIHTAKQFVDFAQNCYIDAWSGNKYVSLEADIDLAGTEFKMIPVFNGIFDGRGHTISGFDYIGDGYVTGLFRYIESKGVVQNLALTGAITSENERECIGSICGINYGAIKNCHFQGTVSGRDTIGGITGINEDTGTISGCTVRGRITGYYSTGGVAGINHGALNYCTNRAGINDDSAWVEEDDEMGIGMGILQSLTSNDDNELHSGVDTGGIAGFSDGMISRCTNAGTVGYEHTGYNIGGIAGRQSGIVSLSTNNGTVYGRKDVGGIVGQMEPFIEINEAESLRNAINKLHDVIEKTIDDMDAASDGISSDVNTMQSYADNAIDTGDALVSQLTDFVDNNVDEVNSVSERMEHIVDMLPDVLNNISAAGDAMSGLNDVASQLAKDLDVLGKIDDASYNETDYQRLSILSTVGGTLTTDSTNPEENHTVTITAVPNDGYQLKDGSLTVTDAEETKIAVTPVSGSKDKYTFVMAKSNVKVTAEFVYKGRFLVKSTVGGRVTTTENGDQVTFKATASGGYTFGYFNVNGSRYPGTESTIVLDKKTYIKSNTSVMVEAVFQKKSGTVYRLSVVSGTGGTASVSGGNTTAAAGEEVAVRIVSAPGYQYQKMLIDGKEVSTKPNGANEITFLMPDHDAEAEVLFASTHSKDLGTHVFGESNAGGTVSVNKGAIGYQITIVPKEGYDVDTNKALTFENVTDKLTLSGTAGSMEESEQESTTDLPISSQAEDVSQKNEESEKSEDSESSEELESTGEAESSEEPESSEELESTGEAESSEESESSEEPESSEELESTEEIKSETAKEENSSEASESSQELESSEPSEEEQTEESGMQSDAAVSGNTTVTKAELEKNDTIKGYTYTVEVKETEYYSAYVSFVKKTDTPNAGASYQITTASSTGGSVAVDSTNVKAGEKVYITPVSNSGYVLKELRAGSESLKSENDKKRYSFIMPNKNVEVTAKFEPVDIILKSNLSGNAVYSGSSEGMITINVKPDSAYTVNSIAVTDAGGKKLSVSKKQSGSYQYEFDISKMTKAPCTVSITFAKQNQKQAVDTSKTNIQDSIKNLGDASDKVQKSVNQIKDIIKKSDGSYKSWNELSSAERDAVVAEVINLADCLSEMSLAGSSILSSLATISNILSPYVTDAAKAAEQDIEKAADQIQRMLDSLKSATNGVRGIINYMNAQPDIRFAKLGDTFVSTKENFHDQLKGLSDSIRMLSDNAAQHSDIINEDLRAVNDQLNVVFNLLADRIVDIEQLSIEELYEEVDDENIDSITTGRADACKNTGIVKGDINVGGVAGSMAIDDEDPEDSAAGSIEYEIGRRFITKCLITDSVNEGYVTSKKDGAGGICGYMNHGIIIDSEGYGSVESIEGDFVGGICGESLTMIQRCYALCSVSGNKNVGGIAGYAETLKNCYSMAEVQSKNGRAGAIAGQIAAYEAVNPESLSEEEPKVAANYYVGDTTYGIDNISYIGVAEPISYQELLEVEQLPLPFWHLKVIYRIEDRYLGSEEVKYGTALDSLHYPQIPEKEGFYGVWPDVTGKKMSGTVVINAEYKDNVTVVQSGGQDTHTENSARQKPYALVEDIFTEDTVLNAVVSEQTPPAQAQGKAYVVYDVSLENSRLKETDIFALRVLNPYENAEVYGYKDTVWTELESKSRGQYLQVGMTGTQEYFCIVEKKSRKMAAVYGAAAAGIIIFFVLLIKKLSGRRKQKRRKNTKKEDK